MHIINITVREKVAAHVRGTFYVCGNSDYMVHFDFDSEWDALDVKTARFIAEDGTIYPDQVFSGSECPVPIISNTNNIRVGVFAGDLHTTTPARVPAVKSILCPDGPPAAPGDDIYHQIMQEFVDTAKAADDATKAVQEAFGESGLYLVRVDAENKADRTQAEIIAAADAGKTCLLINFLGRVYVYRGVQQTAFGDGVSCPTFAAPLEWHGKYWLMTSDAYVYEDGTVSFGSRAPATTPNPKALKLTGAVDATYDGSKAVSVKIPAIPEDKQFVVTVVSTGTGWVSDRSRAEIDAAQAAGKACLMHFPDSGEVMTYHGGYKFASNVYINTASAPGLYYDWAVVNDDKTVDKYGGGPLTAYPGAVSSSKGTCYLRWNGSAWEPATVESVKAELGVQDEGVYELIDTITLNGESTITLTQEPNGTPYNFIDVLVEIETSDKSDVAGHVYPNIYCGQYVVSAYGLSNGIAVGGKRFMATGVSITKGIAETFATSVGHDSSSATTLYRRPRTAFANSLVSRVYVSASVPFPEGTIIIIKGVRA